MAEKTLLCASVGRWVLWCDSALKIRNSPLRSVHVTTGAPARPWAGLVVAVVRGDGGGRGRCEVMVEALPPHRAAD
jgi:hypothetical protein